MAQLLLVLASPLLTRLYSPEEFGVLAVYASVLGILGAVASLQFEVAIPLPKEDSEATNLLVLAVGSVFATSILVWGALMLDGHRIMAILGATFTPVFTFMIPVGMLVAGLYQAMTHWAVRADAFRAITYTRVVQAASSVLVQVVLGVMGASSIGLVIGQIVSQGAGIGYLIRQTFTGHEVQFINRLSLLRTASRYKHFAIVGAPGALLNSAGLQIPTVMISSLYGSGAAGWYMLSRRILGIPITLIGKAVSQVYLSEAAKLARSDLNKLRTLYLRTSFRLLLFIGMPIALVAALGPWLFATIFGAGWAEAGSYTRALSPMLIAQSIVSPLSQTLVVLEAQRYTLIMNAFKVGIVLTSFMIPHSLGLGDFAAIQIYSISMAVYYGISFAITLLLIRLRNARIP